MMPEKKKNHASPMQKSFFEGQLRDPFELLTDDSFFEPFPQHRNQRSQESKAPASAKSQRNIRRNSLPSGLDEDVTLNEFPILNAPAPVQKISHSPQKQASIQGVNGGMIVWGLAAASLILILAGGVWHLWPNPEPVTAFAYCEMRAIGPEGRPVAGAVVRQGEATLGLTDSFGEWRRYMKVRLGTTLTLNIHKKLPSGNLNATKNIAVPAFLPKSGELEIKTQIGLQRDGESRPATSPTSPTSPSSPMITAAPVGQGPTMSQVTKEVRQQNPQEVSQPAAGQPSAASPLRTEGSVASEVAKIWVEERSMLSADDLPRARAVAESLRDLFNQGGFQVSPDAALVLQVGIVKSLASQPPFYYVAGVVKGRTEKGIDEPGRTKTIFSMLRGFQDDPKKSAYDITMGVRRYGLGISPNGQAICKGGVLCSVFQAPITSVPPFPGWQRKQLKLATGEAHHTDADVEVFVSGFMAKSAGNQTFEFWGPPAGPVNVTVVQGLKTIFREKLTPPPASGAPLTVAGFDRRGAKASPKM